VKPGIDICRIRYTPLNVDAATARGRLLSGGERQRAGSAWLKGLPKDERKAIGEDIAYVQFKWPIGKPRVDHLRAAVWEVRTSLANRIARTLFAVEGRRMVLLHGFIKKTRQTPNDDIKLARRNALRSGNVAKRNPRTGSRFDDFLKEEGIFEEVQAKALKRALAEQLQESMQAAKLTKLDMAKKMATSRSQLDRVLDPGNVSVQLDTLTKAARALGKEIEIKIKRAAKKETA
jgi:antitoxin HicB